ncbi:LuxR C-terminal-related transcriptional regulator [Flagellimonas sp.]|uniref:LuxR C-terminal-related transcriptional regulator n=1 Tax=Flagellimonas sp. TaxID=2058762 RepID=UPI003B524CC2
MKNLILLLVFVLSGLQLSAQQAVSGFVNFDGSANWKPQIYLSHLSLSNTANQNEAKPIAIADVQKDGFFKFDKKHFSDSNKIYRLHVERIRKIVNDTVNKEVHFMFSARDKIEFKKGSRVFGTYTNTNQGDREWQKLKTFESKLVKQYLAQENKIDPRKGFVKDSLQILMVKLIGIKQLADKKLLDKDISENPTYYLELLSELKESPIEASEYWFLEKRLAYLTQLAMEQELKTSRWLNLILLVLVAGLGILSFKLGRRTLPNAHLSRQEKNVKALILEGKTNKEIANELFISLSTVKTHITSIYSKLNVKGRQELLQKNTGAST